MQRLKEPWVIPDAIACHTRVLPADSQLLRSTPLRSKGEKLLGQGQNKEPDTIEQAWGVAFTPMEFVQEAVQSGHPLSLQGILPEGLQSAIDKNLDEGAQYRIVSKRAATLRNWLSLADELKMEEEQLKDGMPIHLSNILRPKRILLWEHILMSLKYLDMGVVDEVKRGAALTGEVLPSGIFEKKFKASDMTVEQLRNDCVDQKRALFYSTRSSGDDHVDEEVYSKTLEECEKGWASGPIQLDDVPPDALVSRRFGIQQGEKVRLIDDLSASGANAGPVQRVAEAPKC